MQQNYFQGYYPNINNPPNNGCVWEVSFVTPEKIIKCAMVMGRQDIFSLLQR
jgi:hypothetical protein